MPNIDEVLRSALADIDALQTDLQRSLDSVEPPWLDLDGNEYRPNMWQVMRRK